MKIILAAIAVLSISTAHAQYTSYKDSLGITHYEGRGVTGQSQTDVLGYTHTQIQRHGRQTECTSYRDAVGITHTDCN